MQGALGMKTVGNGRENVLTIPAPIFFLPGTETGTGRSDGKTKPVLWDIGNGKFQTGTC